MKKIIAIAASLVLIIFAATYFYNNTIPANDDLGQEVINNQDNSESVYTNKAYILDKIALPEDIYFKDFDGNEVNLRDYSDKNLIVNFFASWCPNCKEEMPILNQKQADHQDNLDILIVDSLDGDRETRADLEAYIEDNDYDNLHYLIDDEAISYYVFGFTGIPSTVFIDENDNIITYRIGAMDEETFDIYYTALTNKNNIYRDDAFEMVTDQEAMLLDFRSASDFKKGHLENSVNVDNQSLESLSYPLDAYIFVYSDTNDNSYSYKLALEKLGYTKVYDFGGLEGRDYNLVS